MPTVCDLLVFLSVGGKRRKNLKNLTWYCEIFMCKSVCSFVLKTDHKTETISGSMN